MHVSQADWLCSQALMAYLALCRSGSAAAPQAPEKPQAQQAGLHQLQPERLLRVKQLYSAFQSVVRLIQQVSINQPINQVMHASCLWASSEKVNRHQLGGQPSLSITCSEACNDRAPKRSSIRNIASVSSRHVTKVLRAMALHVKGRRQAVMLCKSC